MVLVSHSFVLHSGAYGSEPRLLGLSLAAIAVDTFFVISGFLVTRSLIERANLKAYFLARTLRIYPALIVVVFISVFVLGAGITNKDFRSYMSDFETYTYLLMNCIAFFGVKHYLPGVFTDNPYVGAVNGSLWTLPWELRMYTALVVLWLIAGIVKNPWGISRKTLFEYFVIVTAAILYGTNVVNKILHFSEGLSFFQRDLGYIVEMALHLGPLFFIGGAFYVLRARIVLSHIPACVAVGVFIMASYLRMGIAVVYPFVLAYICLYAAYVPGGVFRRFNYFGDYSYGLYIYAFPVQQTLLVLFSFSTVWVYCLVSFLITLSLALLSWHLVERRCLQWN
jgi:peptidoglycan/LPS O-acetylase OafA/YrhL